MKKYYINEIHNIMQISGNWVFSKSNQPVIGLMLATLEDLENDSLTHVETKTKTKTLLIPFSKNHIGINTYNKFIDLAELDIELKD